MTSPASILDVLNHVDVSNDASFAEAFSVVLAGNLFTAEDLAIRFSAPVSQVHRWSEGIELPPLLRRPLMLDFLRKAAVADFNFNPVHQSQFVPRGPMPKHDIRGFPCHRPQDVTFGPDELVMIQDARTTVGNNVLWWRVDAMGYTSRFDMAWKIPCKQALERCRMEYSVLFRVADIEPLLHRFIDVQEIPYRAGIPQTVRNRGSKKVPIPQEANEG